MRAEYRVGRKLKRTVYQQLAAEPSDADMFLGIFDSPHMAAHVVMLLNADADEHPHAWRAVK